MTGPAEVLGVEASLFSAPRLRDLAGAAAALPRLFRPAAGRPCDIRVIDAAVPSWPRMLGQALDGPARGVMVSAPTLVPPAAVADLAERAERTGCRVVVAVPLAHDAAIGGVLSRLGETPSLVGSHASASDDGGALAPRSALGRALLAQLTAIRMIIGPVPELIVNYETDHAYSVTAVRDATTVMLSGLVSSLPAQGLRVDLAGERRRHTICLGGPAAAPATVWSHGAAGLTRPPLSYSGGLRGAWQNLHDAVTGARPAVFGLRDLALDLAAAASRARA